MISVIIPAFNEEKYLPGAVAAVRRAFGGEEAFEIVTHPITIFLAWRSPTRWKDWYDDAVR